ncbi:MAG: DUF2177 family protein [Candidatus Margulisiibacteriota bacterium]|nr:DUF2177 family protein [Candidatus Margulisiibacteriota bacterium]
MVSFILKFLISFSVFLAIDLLWLGIIARKLYVHHMGHLLRTPPNWPVAFLFYALFVIGIMIFAILPAYEQKNIVYALKWGSLFGFFTYMTYDLTNWAVLKDWPSGIVVIDILWGTILAMSVAGLSSYIFIKFF